MARFGFVGPTYAGRSPADNEECYDWFAEKVESSGESGIILMPRPGKSQFANLGGVGTRGGFEFNGRLFVVSGTVLYELLRDGTAMSLGTVANDGSLASFAASAVELLVISASRAYLLTLSNNTFVDVTALVTAAQGGFPAECGYTDGYFVVRLGNSAKFQISALLNGSSWSGLNFAQVSVFSDNVVGMKVDHREIVLFGRKQSIAYYDSGNTFAYDVIPGGFIEQGIIAQNSLAKLDNTIFGLSGDERGAATAYRLDGYRMVRISTHPVEAAWQSYSTISDAEGFAYQQSGHTFYQLNFPTANASWVYDVATGLWHRRGYWTNGAYSQDRSRWHVYAFGKHLVGDHTSGKIYEVSESFYDDAGNPIRRMRRGPAVGSEMQWIYHRQITFDVETGLGLQAGQGSQPTLMMRYSDDRGKTWSNERQVSAGLVGQYRARAIFRRLGRSRYRVYELSFTDPIPLRLVDAYLIASPGYGPQERAVTQMRKSA